MGLLINGSSKRVTEKEIYDIEPIKFTKTWSPYSHRIIIELTKTVLANKNYKIKNTAFSLSKDKSKLFGVLTISSPADWINYAVGIRNSTDKSLSFGLCSGVNILVCDNLAFDGEFITFQRHTGALTEEQLYMTIFQGINALPTNLYNISSFINTLKLYNISIEEMKIIVYDLINNKCISPSKFHDLLAAINEENEKFPEYAMTIFNIFSAITSLLRKDSLFSVLNKTERTIKILNYHKTLK